MGNNDIIERLWALVTTAPRIDVRRRMNCMVVGSVGMIFYSNQSGIGTITIVDSYCVSSVQKRWCEIKCVCEFFLHFSPTEENARKHRISRNGVDKGVFWDRSRLIFASGMG
jgi:hypothetical protein